MLLAIVAGALLLLCFAVVVAVAKDPGPGPDDVAVSYEHAWDRLDFDAIWTLSSTELRDGLDRKQFVAAKRGAYATRSELQGLAARITADEIIARGDDAVVTTRVDLRDGAVVRNTLQLVRRGGKWQVISYRLSAADTEVGDAALSPE